MAEGMFKFFAAYSHLLFYVLTLIATAGLGGFIACGALSQRNHEPTKASRPWDIVLHPTSCLLLQLHFDF